MSVEQTLLAAQGYIELEMPCEAIAELDTLPAAAHDTEPVLQMRLFIFMTARWWGPALSVCSQLRQLFPEKVAGYLHGAFCLHERGSTAEARTLLLSGPPALKNDATYYYNLGCYSAALGELETAKDYVQTSITMDDKFRQIAKIDPDLFKLRSQF